MQNLNRLLLGLCVIIFCSPLLTALSQPHRTLNCGDIIEAETNSNQKIDTYTFTAPAGTTINAQIEPLAPTFNVAAIAYDEAGSQIQIWTEKAAGIPEIINGFVLPSSNTSIQIGGVVPNETSGDPRLNTGGFGGYVGAYIIRLGCVLRDGTVIQPGQTSSPAVTTPNQAFSGVGFPGLAPKDFSDGVMLPLTAGTPNAGSITTNFASVFGYTFDAHANDTFDLDFKRLAGNLNLGLAVLSPDNKIVFQASLVTSDTLSTQFSLPSDGTYTIGVYKIDLLPPDAPENTAFQITGTLNP
ncbi:MAG: hypothetical protein GC204_15500 [Chloroflexi bacterium]|nr:hypothetical protein [Chloroflexota bacterium]